MPLLLLPLQVAHQLQDRPQQPRQPQQQQLLLAFLYWLLSQGLLHQPLAHQCLLHLAHCLLTWHLAHQ